MVAVEELVFELQLLAISTGDFFEPICIKLANKRAQVPVLEVLREHICSKTFCINDSEGVSIVRPTDSRFPLIGSE